METMIIVVIIGIVAGITIPTFMKYFEEQKIRGAVNELMADISYARSLAIARRTTYQLVFAAGSYQLIEPGPDTVMRARTLDDGLTLAADANPNFYPHGLADAANILIDGVHNQNLVTLLPNGTASHD